MFTDIVIMGCLISLIDLIFPSKWRAVFSHEILTSDVHQHIIHTQMAKGTAVCLLVVHVQNYKLLYQLSIWTDE